MIRSKLIAILVLMPLTALMSQEELLSKQEAVIKVLENNFGIQVAKNQVEIAENNSDLLNSGFLPTLTGNAGANYQRDDSTFEFPGQFTTDPDTGNRVPRPDAALYKAEAQRFNAGLTANVTVHPLG